MEPSARTVQCFLVSGVHFQGKNWLRNINHGELKAFG